VSKAKAKPSTVKPTPQIMEPTEHRPRCIICNHAWINGFINDSLAMTRAAGNGLPSYRVIAATVRGAAADLGSDEPMPSKDSIYNHLSNGHSAVWTAWRGQKA